MSSRHIPHAPPSSFFIFTPSVSAIAGSMISAKILPSSIATSHCTSMNVVPKSRLVTSSGHDQLLFHGIAHHPLHAFLVRFSRGCSWSVGTVEWRVSLLLEGLLSPSPYLWRWRD
ncbi:hypothetical protein V6N11_061949 [Hibiscus sabdariffa]|uniref:Uncharacterized protein n=1 Tax=Hibiscus sabdariffa TaxID=183260 RepID=A0ABR2PRP0_9ROSI